MGTDPDHEGRQPSGADHGDVRLVPPLLDDLYQAFGPDRLMWGSDYPPVAAREGYRLALRLVMDEYAAKDERAKEAIFGGTAARVFPVRP